MTTKTTPAESRFELPLGKGKPETIIATVNTQLATARSAPDLPNQQKIADAIKATQDDADAAKKIIGEISTTHAALTALINARNTQMFSLRMNHEALQVAINLAGKGNKAYLQTYGGAIVARSELALTDDAPLNPTLKATKISGEARAHCKKDDRAFAYAYQFGADPGNPDGWPKPIIESGCTHVASGLPIGQKLYCRIAILRRGVGQGKWSPVMDLLVR